MGLVDTTLGALFGGGRNVVKETVEVFRENAEGAAVREAAQRQEALRQYAAEFALPRKGAFDRLMDGLNRLPRPLLAYGTIGLFIVAMVDPVWFTSRMQGIAVVPEPLWWLMGAIVSFYFGARHQAHSQAFQRSIAETLARVPAVMRNTAQLEALRETTPGVAETAPSANLTRHSLHPGTNAALADWQAGQE